jgi:galactonate dehydratase
VKIASVRSYLVPPEWHFVRVDTDEGLVGWGEAGIQGRARTVATAVAELAELLVGEDPLRIEDHWQVMTRGAFHRGGPILAAATAAVDIALWDLAGKARDEPTHRLVGGPVRERIRAYSWLGGDAIGAHTPEALAAEATASVAAGFTALKVSPSPLTALDRPGRTEEIVERIAAVRAAIGPEVDLALDCHGRCSRATAQRLLPLLEPYHLLFVEEPVVPELTDALAELAAASPVPLATGERLYSRWEFKDVVRSGIAVVQPDVSHAGGFSETRRIAALAETYGVQVAPHCPLGPIALAAALQLDFCTPNVLIQEQGIDHFGDVFLDYLVDPAPFALRDGCFERPLGPGLGIDVDGAAVARAAELGGHRPRSRMWRQPDGALGEF